jgi:hypothetical protein
MARAWFSLSKEQHEVVVVDGCHPMFGVWRNLHEVLFEIVLAVALYPQNLGGCFTHVIISLPERLEQILSRARLGWTDNGHPKVRTKTKFLSLISHSH